MFAERLYFSDKSALSFVECLTKSSELQGRLFAGIEQRMDDRHVILNLPEKPQ